jgi:hypothetical protein
MAGLERIRPGGGGDGESAGQPPYPGNLFYEMLPELDPAIRHLGAKALRFTVGTAAASTSDAAVDLLPDLEEYLAARYPQLSPAAVAELTEHLHELTRPRSTRTDQTHTTDGRTRP